MRADPPRCVVIGAGIGGLTTAGLLARAGLDVTVLEAHVYAGGCAGTFFHKGYRFDAGATLAGGFYPGGPMARIAEALQIASWPAHATDPAMSVILPDDSEIVRWGDDARRREANDAAFGARGVNFWRWQERTADLLWDLALAGPPWPPQSALELLATGQTGLAWLVRNRVRLHPDLLVDAFAPVARHLKGAPARLRQFVDAQLLIAAQTTSSRANALYGASALDLPRRGVVHLHGGIGAIGGTMVSAVRNLGGKVHFRQTVTRIVVENGRPIAVETKRGEHFPADVVVANLPPWNITELLGDHKPPRLRTLPAQPADGWGAFMVYVGIDAAAIASDAPLHRQVIVREPMAEGNTVFLSASPDWDATRAPAGQRAVTISTHTSLAPWWKLMASDRQRYEQRKRAYAARLLKAAERAIPGLREATHFTMAGTPVTFQRFTRRRWGWVGGFPQTDLFRAWAPRIAPGLWMVGDTIFPGQSIPAVALGGLRVAQAILDHTGIRQPSQRPVAAVVTEAGSGD